MSAPTITELRQHLGELLHTDCYDAGEQGGLYTGHASGKPVPRLGLTLDPWPALPDWIQQQRLDALWLHRPWKLSPHTISIPVLYHHLPFDEHLTIGYNLFLARQLSLTGLQPFGIKQSANGISRPIGMLGDCTAETPAAWQAKLAALFNGLDRAELNSTRTVNRIVVVGAMNEALVTEAVSRGVDLYITGQYRPAVGALVREHKLSVIAVGHQRCEQYGLQVLAGYLTEKIPYTTIILQT